MTRPITRYPRYAAAGLSTVLLLACTGRDVDRAALGSIDTLASPAAPGSGEPNLATGTDGRVYLSWIEPVGDSAHALRFSTLENETWSSPRTIAQRSDFFVNWADFPSIVPLSDRALAAHWLQRSGGAKYAYEVRISHSADGGATWSEPLVPHRDGTATEHGFVSLFPFRDSLGAIWLDGRNFAQDSSTKGANMMLLMTAIAPGGAPGAERVLDERVCDCCQTSLAVAATGPIVVYRDRLEGEIRDISVIRWADTGWSRPSVVQADNWKIDACPVNGPAIAADGERVAVAWFTSARDSARVYLATSANSGRSFGEAVRIDDGNPVGRVDVEVDGRGGTIVSWMEFTSGQQADVRVRRIGPDGERSTSSVVAHTSGARASGFPRMTAQGKEVVFAWTEAGSPARIRVARTRLDE
jgi:hypothetical protein